jgi:hypothetical protein
MKRIMKRIGLPNAWQSQTPLILGNAIALPGFLVSGAIAHNTL